MVQDNKTENKPKLGELLVQYGIITAEMLSAALKRQQQAGGQIGSLLIELGYLTTENLLEFLQKQLGVPTVNLFNVDIPKEILKVLPFEKIKQYKVLPLQVDGKLTIAMVNPKDFVALRDVEFILGRTVTPVVVPSAQMKAAIRSLEKTGPADFRGAELEKTYVSISSEEMGDIKIVLKRLQEFSATDVQLTAGAPPSLKMGSELTRLNMPVLTPAQMQSYANMLLDEGRRNKFAREKDLDFAFTDPEYGRYRVNFYMQRNSVSITLRHIADTIPSLKALGLSEDIEDYALKTQGLIIITGPAGHGKSTTLASILDIINTKRKCNIITLEDPIEYLHKHKNSNVNQREIGLDTESFSEGLKHIFRQDPDVIVIGEMRDRDSFKIALQAAETGHLVLSTLHSRNSTSTIDRVIDTFPSEQQPQIRSQLADSLLLVLSQRLVLKKDRSGQVLAYERLTNTVKAKIFIRDGKTHQIRSQMQLPTEEYSSIDVSLSRLCIEGKITVDEGLKHADNVSFFLEMVKKQQKM